MQREASNPDYWLRRAREMRELASTTYNVSIRRTMEEIAGECDRMAQSFEEGKASLRVEGSNPESKL